MPDRSSFLVVVAKLRQTLRRSADVADRLSATERDLASTFDDLAVIRPEQKAKWEAEARRARAAAAAAASHAERARHRLAAQSPYTG